MNMKFNIPNGFFNNLKVQQEELFENYISKNRNNFGLRAKRIYFFTFWLPRIYFILFNMLVLIIVRFFNLIFFHTLK